MFTITLDEETTATVKRGVPWLPVGAHKNVEPGRPLRYVDPHGQQLAIGVADPENDVLRIWARELSATVGPALFAARVQDALAMRRGLGLCRPDGAYRLLHGDGD